MSPIVLLLSSSRGGSSIFAEALRRSSALAHLPGEVNPALREVGLGADDAGTGSDTLGVAHARARGAAFLARLDAEAGQPGTVDTPTLAHQVHARLRRQWPALDLPEDAVIPAVTAAAPRVGDPAAFTRAVLAALAPRWPVTPGLYDLARRPDDATPVPARVLEEPPFLPLAPWRPAPPGLPLVVKAPSNAYRLDFWAALGRPLRVLHLTRSPAAAVNGLVDGWLYPGFHAWERPPLAIAGYSDRVPGGERWWKFDLPPGWEAWRARPLSEVAGFQWAAAHRAALDGLARHPGLDVLRLRFEDVLADLPAALARVHAWLGLPLPPEALPGLDMLPTVMATAPPRQRRWFDRAEALGPVLARPDVVEVAEALGYRAADGW